MPYHQFVNEDGEMYGSFETFYADAKHGRELPAGVQPTLLGWYWWPCFPGCLPDSDPYGPFDTEAEAIADARNASSER